MKKSFKNIQKISFGVFLASSMGISLINPILAEENTPVPEPELTEQNTLVPEESKSPKKSSADITFNYPSGEHHYAENGNSYIIIAKGADWVKFNGKTYTEKNYGENIGIEDIRQMMIDVPKGTIQEFTLTAGVEGDDVGITYTWYEDKKDPILTLVEITNDYVLYESDEPLDTKSSVYIAYEQDGRYYAKIPTSSLSVGYNKNAIRDSTTKNATWYTLYKDESGNVSAFILDETPTLYAFVEGTAYEVPVNGTITKPVSDTIIVNGFGIKSAQIGAGSYLNGEKLEVESLYDQNYIEYPIANGIKDKTTYSGKYEYTGGSSLFKFSVDYSLATYTEQLATTLHEMKEKNLNPEMFTPESWSDYQYALDTATYAYKNPTATDDTMIKADESLKEAFNNLVAKQENSAPVINAKDVTIEVGDTFDPLKGVTATDKEDGDITKNIKVVNNEVNVKKAGTYTVTYEVTDTANVTVSKSIKVTVKEKAKKDDKDVKTSLQTNSTLWFVIGSLGLVSLFLIRSKKHS